MFSECTGTQTAEGALRKGFRSAGGAMLGSDLAKFSADLDTGCKRRRYRGWKEGGPATRAVSRSRWVTRSVRSAWLQQAGLRAKTPDSVPQRRSWTILAVVVALALALLALPVMGDEHNHVYKEGEDVIAWVNTVGPFANQQETYKYYHLPFCRGTQVVEHRHETIGEALQGMDLVNAGMGLKFKVNQENVRKCEAKKLTSQQIHLFRTAILNSYTWQMYIDDLPVRGYVGTYTKGSDPALYTHREFTFQYNGDKIIEVDVESGNPVPLPKTASGIDIPFTYTAVWKQTDKPFNERFSKYLDSAFFEHKIHWFSIVNSFMMVIFLTGLVVVILFRALKRDLARCHVKDEEIEMGHDLEDEYGWKQVQGDVFRAPPKLLLFSALLGLGNQLSILTFCVIMYTIAGDLYIERSTILTATIFLYALTSAVAGYTSASHYAKYGGKNWVKSMVLTASLWPGIVTAVTVFVNTIAIYYSSSRAIPFVIMLAVLAIWLFLVFPLTLLGAIVGRNWAGQPDFPCRVNPIPRPLPEKVWYTQPIVIIFAGGVLPFGSIFIEMYFVFTSFWAYKIYYVYGFMLLVYFVLLIVTACVTIVSTYSFLNSEDHRWHWVSFLTAGSTGLYVYLYSVYYFFARTSFYGVFQTTFYHLYMVTVCLGLFAMLGFVGHWATLLFLKKIYANVKID